MSGTHLRGPIGESAVHLCIDMQRLLASEGPWPTPWMKPALERQVRLVERDPTCTVFTRFIPPRTPEEMPGVWRRYYDKWRSVTRDFLDPSLLELVYPLVGFVPPAEVVDKTRYSAFCGSALQDTLTRLTADTLIVSGAETDVCVLSSVMSAVDHGFRVIVARDGVCSSSDTCHDALMTLYHQRFSEQIEIADTETVLSSWRTRARLIAMARRRLLPRPGKLNPRSFSPPTHFLVELLLPLKDNSGRPFPPMVWERVKNALVERFGGVTAYTRSAAEGIWGPAPGEKSRDDVFVVEVLAKDLERDWWRDSCDELEKILQQEKLMVRAVPAIDLQ